jgi:hypothetical protein
MPEAADAPAPKNHAMRFGLNANAVENSAADITGTVEISVLLVHAIHVHLYSIHGLS